MVLHRSTLDVVLVPGLDGTGTLFEPVIQALGPGYAPHIVRYRPGLQSFEAHIEDVLTVVDGVARPLILVGESFGGPVSVAVARARPDLVKALCLVATFVTRPSWNTGLIRPLHRAVTSIPWPPALLRVVLGYLLAERGTDARLMQQLVAVNDHRASAVLAHRLGITARVDQREALRELTIPVGYLGGTADRIVPCARHAELIRQLHPATRIEMLPGAPHMLLQLRAQACTALIGELVAAADLA
ncbi:MAG: alpha/beta hydrolase [Pseudomonadota bacterium]